MSKKSTKMTKIPFRKAKKVINKIKICKKKEKRRKNILKTSEGHIPPTPLMQLQNQNHELSFNDLLIIKCFIIHKQRHRFSKYVDPDTFTTLSNVNSIHYN